MRPNRLAKKLSLSKNTVSNLKILEMKTIKGGVTVGINCNTIYSCLPTWCPDIYC